jgi:DNA-binding NarL/FixJ family response regulator
MPIKVIFADDNRLIRELLVNHLLGLDDIEVIAQAENGKDAIEFTGRYTPDVVIMDIDMPVMDGVKATAAIHEDFPEVRIIALTMHTKAQVVKRMLEAGASGYLSKNCDPADLISAIRTVASGGKYLSEEITNIVIKDYLSKDDEETAGGVELSERETEILKLIVNGVPVSSIADKLFLSVKTVNTHRQNILEKLDLRSTPDLVKYALKKGIISLDN